MTTETKTPVTYDNVLSHLATHAHAATSANFTALAAGTLAYCVGFVWADPKTRKDAKSIRGDIVSAFNETTVAGKSKRYEFAGLCLTIARAISKGDTTSDHAYGGELKKLSNNGGSIEESVQFLAARFGDKAKSVAELARSFGTARSSGGNTTRKGLPAVIKTWLDKMEKDDTVAFCESVELMLDAASEADMAVVVRKLIGRMNIPALAELMVVVNGSIESRQRKAEGLIQAEATRAASAQTMAEVERMAA